jgi:hypothetical protein
MSIEPLPAAPWQPCARLVFPVNSPVSHVSHLTQLAKRLADAVDQKLNVVSRIRARLYVRFQQTQMALEWEFQRHPE